ncbi:MAG: YbjN domain-containing protein [Clostridia bacterium]|nr:YbjN domain-containing protein [Clostridia bacterium]
MLKCAKSFIDKLDEKELKYEHSEDEDGSERVRISFKTDNAQNVRLNYFFDENDMTVNIKVFSLAEVPVDKLMDMYVLMNQLNSEYRWVTFYLDEDNEVTISGDAVVEENTAGDELYQLAGRFLNIIDDVYPRIMKVRWS